MKKDTCYVTKVICTDSKGHTETLYSIDMKGVTGSISGITYQQMDDLAMYLIKYVAWESVSASGINRAGIAGKQGDGQSETEGGEL